MVDPPNQLVISGMNTGLFTLLAAVIVDVIWRLRNAVQFQVEKGYPEVLPLRINQNFSSFHGASNVKWLELRERRQVKWETPQSTEKFNAAENSGQVCLSRFVRDHNGGMLMAWTTKIPC